MEGKEKLLVPKLNNLFKDLAIGNARYQMHV
jgi:hypothetical protein